MGDTNNKMILDIKNPEFIDFERLLIKDHFYLNFRFYVHLNSDKDCKKIIKFLEDADILPTNMFSTVDFMVNESNFIQLEHLLNKFILKNQTSTLVKCKNSSKLYDKLLDKKSHFFIYNCPKMPLSLLKFCSLTNIDILDFNRAIENADDEGIVEKVSQNPLSDILISSLAVNCKHEFCLNSVKYEKLTLCFNSIDDLSNSLI